MGGELRHLGAEAVEALGQHGAFIALGHLDRFLEHTAAQPVHALPECLQGIRQGHLGAPGEEGADGHEDEGRERRAEGDGVPVEFRRAQPLGAEDEIGDQLLLPAARFEILKRVVEPGLRGVSRGQREQAILDGVQLRGVVLADGIECSQDFPVLAQEWTQITDDAG